MDRRGPRGLMEPPGKLVQYGRCNARLESPLGNLAAPRCRTRLPTAHWKDGTEMAAPKEPPIERKKVAPDVRPARVGTAFADGGEDENLHHTAEAMPRHEHEERSDDELVLSPRDKSNAGGGKSGSDDGNNGSDGPTDVLA